MSPCSRSARVERGGERSGVLDQREHDSGDIWVHRLGERLPHHLELLGEEVGAVALAAAERWGGHLQAHGLESQELHALAPEALPHLVHRGQHAPVRLARQDAVVVQQLVGDVAHDQPPGVAFPRSGDHGVVEGGRQPVEQATGEQQALAPRVGVHSTSRPGPGKSRSSRATIAADPATRSRPPRRLRSSTASSA
jgi:hypothetical protein